MLLVVRVLKSKEELPYPRKEVNFLFKLQFEVLFGEKYFYLIYFFVHKIIKSLLI